MSHGKSIRDLFLLEPDTAYLNHGAFGATPREVLASWQAHQGAMEANPTRWFQRVFPAALPKARAEVAALLNAAPADTAFVPNATYASNVVAASLPFGPGDEVLTIDEEYGACLNALRFHGGRAGWSLRIVPWAAEAEDPAEAFLAQATPQTKAIFISHITSPTARVLPVAELARRARAAGLIVLVDGAHAIGQLEVDVAEIDADAWFGNAHKWLCAPKTVAVLHVAPRFQPHIQPAIAGWGWGADRTRWAESAFQDLHAWLGTLDYAAWLALPDAIAFQRRHEWSSVRTRCTALAAEALAEGAELMGLPPPYAPASQSHAQMVCLPIRSDIDGDTLQRNLQAAKIEAPVSHHGDELFVRVSVQGYNDTGDLERLFEVLRAAR